MSCLLYCFALNFSYGNNFDAVLLYSWFEHSLENPFTSLFTLIYRLYKYTNLRSVSRSLSCSACNIILQCVKNAGWLLGSSCLTCITCMWQCPVHACLRYVYTLFFGDPIVIETGIYNNRIVLLEDYSLYFIFHSDSEHNYLMVLGYRQLLSC